MIFKKTILLIYKSISLVNPHSPPTPYPRSQLLKISLNTFIVFRKKFSLNLIAFITTVQTTFLRYITYSPCLFNLLYLFILLFFANFQQVCKTIDFVSRYTFYSRLLLITTPDFLLLNMNLPL